VGCSSGEREHPARSNAAQQNDKIETYFMTKPRNQTDKWRIRGLSQGKPYAVRNSTSFGGHRKSLGHMAEHPRLDHTQETVLGEALHPGIVTAPLELDASRCGM
jgi:hypothetical protein